MEYLQAKRSWKLPDGLQERRREDSVNCFCDTLNRLADEICNSSISKATANHCDGEQKQRGLEFFQEDDRVAPASFPLPNETLHAHLTYPSMGRRTLMRRTLSPI